MWPRRSSGGSSTLGRARRAGVIIALVTQLMCLVQVDGSLPLARQLVAYAAMLVLVSETALAWLRLRSTWTGALMGGPLLFAIGQALTDKPAIIALAIGVLVAHSLFGGRGLALTRIIGLIAGINVAMVLGPMLDHAPAVAPAGRAISLLVLTMLSVVLRTMYNALISQQEAAHRESLLARTSRSLLGVTDVTHARQLVGAAADDLCAATPGLELAVATQSRGPRITILQPKAPAAEIQDVVETLAAQLSLSEASCISHAELLSLAHQDQLTSIPNRAAFFSSLTRALEEPRGDHNAVGLMVIDLDDFKVVNDSLGHAAGDQVLIEIARRLNELVAGHGVAGRFGGDEFAVLLVDLENPEQAESLARDLCQRLVEPIPWGDRQLQVGASIGVATGMPDVGASELMRCADIAMYSAKALGKNRVIRFTDDEHGQIATLRHLEDRMPGGDQRRERLNQLRGVQPATAEPMLATPAPSE